VLAPYAAVMTQDDTLLFDLSPYYGAATPSQHPVFLRCRPPALTEVPGSVGVLSTRGSDNYYHFVLDVLPRLELLRRAGAEPDAYLVNRSTRFQRDMLDHLGLTADRCLGDEKYPHVRADELVVPSLPDDDLRTPSWIVPWLRTRFLPDDLRAPHRRLYVSRGHAKHTRRVENEAELVDALAPFGFEVIDPGTLSPAEQVRAFAEAECIVGPHGAGLTNLAFAAPGAAVVELFARDYVNECFWALASTVEGLRYRYLVGDGTPLRSRRNRGVASDIRVGPRQVLQLIDELIG
jgi:capsular polysaccharide biosynthesis protein